MRAVAFVLGLALTPAFATPARAQQPPRLPLVVFDARLGVATFGKDARTAADLGVATTRESGSGWAGIGGVHIYPVRWWGGALGVGAEVLFVRPFVSNDNAMPLLQGPATITRRLSGWDATASLNLPGPDKWFYVSAGAGPLRFESFSSALPHARPAAEITPNVGAGARWFTTRHLAPTVDVRVFFTGAAAATATTAGRNRRAVLLLSAGIAIR